MNKVSAYAYGAPLFFFVITSIGLYYAAFDTHRAHFDLDSYGYDRIAHHGVETGYLLDPTIGSAIPVQTLGYPFFLSIIYQMLGNDCFWVIIIQVLCSLIIAFIISLLALLFFNETIGYIAFALSCCNAGFLIYSQFVLTDILLAMLLTLGIYFFMFFYKHGYMPALLASGFIFGISVIVKPVALLYVFLLYLWLWWHAKTWRAALQQIALFALLFYGPVLAYMQYNYHTFGQFVVAPVMKENIYCYFLSKIHAQVKEIPYQEARKDIVHRLENKTTNDPQRWSALHTLLIHYLKTKPWLAFKTWCWDVSKTACAPYINQFKFLMAPHLKGTETSLFAFRGPFIDHMKWYIGLKQFSHAAVLFIVLIIMATLMQYCCMLIGMITLMQQKQYALLLFCIGTIFYFAIITGHDGCARYRLMFENMYILLAAVGCMTLYNCFARKRYQTAL